MKEGALRLESLLGGPCEVDRALIKEFQAYETKFLAASGHEDSSVELKTLAQKVEVAQASLELESAQAIPNLRLGPQVELVKENGINDQRFGFNLSLDLPLWNRNNRQQEVERLDLLRLERDYELAQKKQEAMLGLVREKYRALQKALAAPSFGNRLHEKHSEAEALFKKGVISTALIIEVHRQLLELLTSRQSLETELVLTLWQGLNLQGAFNPFKKMDQ